jgi:hypothetical protein
MRNIILLVCSMLMYEGVFGQKIEDIRLGQVGDEIIITFDLVPKESARELFDIEIKASVDNYTKALKVKKGEIKGIAPGSGLQIVISSSENFSEHNGELDFSINAKLVYSPLRFLSPKMNAKQVMGKQMLISWKGGMANEPYTLELYQGDLKMSNIVSGITAKDYAWKIPKKSNKGNFKIKIASGSNQEKSSFSSEFMIKKKFPIIFVLAPVAIIGGVLATMGGGGGSGGQTPDVPVNNDLPSPPEAPSI